MFFLCRDHPQPVFYKNIPSFLLLKRKREGKNGMIFAIKWRNISHWCNVI
jgi:hypothetical protein